MTDFVEKAYGKINKLSDEQLGILMNRIKDENEVFDSIIQGLPCGLIIIDKDFHVIKINRAAKRFIPVNFKHIQNEVVWDHIEDEDIADFIRQCGEKKIANKNKEFSIAESDGKIRFVVVSVLPLLHNSEIDGNIIFIEDVTAKRQQEILMHRMKSLNSLTSLAASVAHEIKNPLGAISIHIQLLQKAIKKSREGNGLLPDEKFLENYLCVVNEEIDNLNKIVMDFLFAVRPVQANIELSSADSIVERTIGFFKPEFDQNNIDVLMDLDEADVRVMIDIKLFKEVIVNLIQNAKAAVLEKNGNSGGHLAVKSFIKNDSYILTVADNGIGMDAESCSRIFEPYYTTKADGTGLGLTTVYKIIKEFRGDISVNSEKGTGTIFTISIPVPQQDTLLLEGKK